MKLPRDLSGSHLVQHLTSQWDDRKIHQVGSHVTLETDTPSKQRIVIPLHRPPASPEAPGDSSAAQGQTVPGLPDTSAASS